MSNSDVLAMSANLVAYVEKLKACVPRLANEYPYDGVDCAKFVGPAVTLDMVQTQAARGLYGMSIEKFLNGAKVDGEPLYGLRRPFIRALQWYTGPEHGDFRFAVRAALTDVAREMDEVVLFPGFERCRDALDSVYTRNPVLARAFAFNPALYADGAGGGTLWLGKITKKLESLRYPTFDAFCADLYRLGEEYLARTAEQLCIQTEYAHFICSTAKVMQDFQHSVHVSDRGGKGPMGGPRVVSFNYHRIRDALVPGSATGQPSELFSMVGVVDPGGSVWRSVAPAEVGSPYARFIVSRVYAFLKEYPDLVRGTEAVTEAWAAFNAKEAEVLKAQYHAARGGAVVGGKGVAYTAVQKTMEDIALLNCTQFIEFWGAHPTFERAVVQAGYLTSIQNGWVGAPGPGMEHLRAVPGESPELDALLARVEAGWKDASTKRKEIALAVKFVDGGGKASEFDAWVRVHEKETQDAAKVRASACERRLAGHLGVDAYRSQMTEAERVRLVLAKSVRCAVMHTAESEMKAEFIEQALGRVNSGEYS